MDCPFSSSHEISMYSLIEFSFRPNPLDVIYASAQDGDVEQLFLIIKKQKVPAEYKDDARRAMEEEHAKKEKLSADGRIVHALLGYREGLSHFPSFSFIFFFFFLLALSSCFFFYPISISLSLSILVCHGSTFSDAQASKPSKRT